MKTLSAAAVLADEYMLTHRTVFLSVSAEKPRHALAAQNDLNKLSSPKKEESVFIAENLDMSLLTVSL